MTQRTPPEKIATENLIVHMVECIGDLEADLQRARHLVVRL